MSKEGDNAFALWSRGATEASSCSSMESWAKGVSEVWSPQRGCCWFIVQQGDGRAAQARAHSMAFYYARSSLTQHHRLQLPANRVRVFTNSTNPRLAAQVQLQGCGGISIAKVSLMTSQSEPIAPPFTSHKIIRAYDHISKPAWTTVTLLPCARRHRTQSVPQLVYPASRALRVSQKNIACTYK